ncbi:MAG: hypothetical protein GC166_03545 [Alphaproteobacteria bacterium]|nr:hypothetical protein [Alphaproteobacteria bacterium]
MIGSAMACTILVAGCGTTTNDRALSGGLLGGAAGLAIGSVTGSAGKGALIGAIAGAATGALTDPCDVNLGDPPWHNDAEKHRWEKRCHRRY